MQKDSDPFSFLTGGEQTVFVPSPGGRRRHGEAKPQTTFVADRSERVSTERLPQGAGRNPLLRAAASLFALIRQIRATRHHDDLTALRNHVIEAIRQFDTNVRRAGIEARPAAQAGYALCGLIDETVLSTPWGIESIWTEQNLLTTFYRERTAGERFFKFLDNARHNPGSNIDLLEFFYVCLCLGFQGRYRVEPGGVDRLARLRQDLFTVVSRERGEDHQALSPRWQGVYDRRPRFSHYLPWWVACVAGLAAVLLVYTGLSLRLNEISDKTYAEIGQLIPGVVDQVQQPVTTMDRPAGARDVLEPLRLNFSEELRSGQLQLIDLGDAARIILQGDQLFASGSARVGQSFTELINKLGVYLADFPGPYTISGHTDNVPMTRSIRYQSNYDLSRARAEAVAEALARTMLNPPMIRIEGRADGEPIASNKTAEGRSLNRRVEIRIPLKR